MTTRRMMVACFLLLAGTVVFALSDSDAHDVQMNIPEVAMIALDDTNLVTLVIQQPGAAGDPPTDSLPDTSKYLRYTAVNTAAAGGDVRDITVAWGALEVAPAGTTLTVEATIGGGAEEGTSAGVITISAVAQDLITAIGSCATGTLATDGANLEYILDVGNATLLRHDDDKLVTVTFTLIDGY